MRHRWSILLLVALLAPALALAGAETSGKIVGRVTGEDAKPVKGVQVTASSSALQGERTVATDASGRFIVPFLPPGAYSVLLTAPDLQPKQFTLRVGIGQQIPLDVVMKKGTAITETVNVLGEASKMQTTAGGENFNYAKQINDLPVPSREIERVAELAPNVAFGPTPGTLSIAGAPSFDTVVLLDGAEISDPYFGSAPIVYLEEAVEEVQVLTTGISARYGRFQGGVINAVTKSGGNTFDGSARVDLSKQTWNQTTPSHEDQSDTLNKVYSATLGGPILKDRLWFFVGGRTIPSLALSHQTELSLLDYTTTTDEDRYQLKLTGAPSPNHNIDVSYLNYSRSISGYAGLPAADLRALGAREDPREIYTLEYDGILSDKLFLNVQATKKNVEASVGATDVTLGSPFLDLYNSSDFQIWHNSWWDLNDPSVRDNETASVSLTQVLSTGSWGDHTLEYGISYVNSKTAGENRQTPTGFNLLNYDAVVSGNSFSNVGEGGFDPANPLFNLISYYDAAVGVTYRWVALPVGGDQQLKNMAAYVQDSWQKGKWRVDAGLHYDKYDGSGPTPTLDMNFSKLGPRLGVTYNVNPNWQLQASWGRYVSRFNDNVASTITGVSGAPYVVQLYTGPTQCALGTHCLTYDDVETALQDDTNWGITTTITDVTQPTRFLAKNANAPYADDLNVGVKHAFARNTGSFTLTYTYRKYRDLLDDFVGGQGTVTVTDPLAVPPGSGVDIDLDRTIWANSSLAERNYKAWTATWDYRPTVHWSMGGNVTLSSNRGNYEGEGRNTPASGSIIGTYPNSVDQAKAIPYGYLQDDIARRVRAWCSRSIDFGRAGSLSLGSVLTYQSGSPYNLSGSVSYVDDPTYLNDQGTYTYFTDGRGNHRFRDFWSLDLATRYQATIAKDVSGYVKLDIFNVTNRDQLIAFNTSGSIDPGTLQFVPGGNFGLARNENDYQTPRRYFVSVGIQF